jgi:glycosyltransferase involved in cell wall biosynthesis
MRDQHPKEVSFSLILATIGRKDELRTFFESLLKQTYNNFEVIISDQNPDNKINDLVDFYSGNLLIRHIKSEIGLSRARNKGLKLAKGDILAFPDDDCWYQANLLEQVANLLISHSDWDGISGIAKSGKGNNSRWKWAKDSGRINRENVWQRSRSITIFLRKEIVHAVGEFDISLGLGSGTLWNSGEETDFLIRAIEKDFTLQYYPEIVINHPDEIPLFDKAEIAKGRGYGLGMGKVLKKHHYSMGFVLLQILLPIGSIIKSILKFNFPRVCFFYNVWIGRLIGWLS